MDTGQHEEDSVGSVPTSAAELTTLYVLVYPSPLFAAHWSFWLPYPAADGRVSDTGDRVHATGDRLNGFEYEYLRGYNAKEDSRRPNSYAIGRILRSAVIPTTPLTSDETTKDDSEDADQSPLNEFDRSCRQVPVPGPSLNKVVPGSAAGHAVPRKLQVKDCQWWIKQAVAHLVEAGILLPLESEGSRTETPFERVDVLPKH